MFIIPYNFFIIQIIAKNICAYEECVHLTLPPHTLLHHESVGSEFRVN